MFQKIAGKIQYPEWVNRVPRYRQLDLRDRLLCGTFYDHLKAAFYDEIDQSKALILLEDRRPAAQFRLPSMVARWSNRKLFAGRHRPKLRIKGNAPAAKPAAGDAPAKKTPNVNAKLGKVNTLLRRSRFWQKMGEAVFFGSVGAVAVTFKVEGAGDDARLALSLWQAKYCKPSFDEFGNLSQLRVQYTTTAAQLRAAGITADMDGKPLEDAVSYWYVRDYLTEQEVTYGPIKQTDWNPVDGFTADKNKTLKPIADMTVSHDLGFVPGHWFVNLVGGEGSDGACTWGDAIPNSIDLDYTLSQIGRGIRYNSAPQLVTIGEVIGGGDITRGPSAAISMRAGYKDEDGQTYGEGDAKLLEMSGTGVAAALSFIDHLRNYALEQIAASRKDPDKMKAPLSGRAMEYLDEDSNDLVMELRTQYGEDGALPLIKKIALAAEVLKPDDVGGLTLQWPRMFQPTPDELFALVQSLQIAVDPLKATQPGQPATPGKPAGATSAATPGTPEQPPQRPEATEQFLTIAEARAYLVLQMDMAMLDLDATGDEDEEADESPTAPGQNTDPVPLPSVLVEPPADPSDPNAPATHQQATPPGMIVHASSVV